jgi:hypothetical protein
VYILLQRVAIAWVFASPHLPGQLIVGEQLAGMLGKTGKKAKLNRRQLNGLALEQHLGLRQIDHQPFVKEAVRLRPGGCSFAAP